MYFPAFRQYINKNSSKKETTYPSGSYSLRHSMIVTSVLAGLIFFSVSLFITYYFSNRLLDNTYQNIHQELTLYSEQLTRNLTSVENGLYQFAINDSQAGLLSTLSPASNTTVYQVRVKSALETLFPCTANIDGLFLYAPKTDAFISHFENNDAKCRDYLRKLMRNPNSDAPLNTSEWYFVSLNDSDYMVRILRTTYCYIGAWAHLDTLTESFMALKNNGTQFLYVDPEGHAIDGKKWSDHTFDLSSPAKVLTVKDSEETSYLQITYPLNFCQYSLAALVPKSNVLQLLQSIYRFIVVLFFVLLVLSAVMLLFVNRLIASPLIAIRNISSSIHDQKNAITEFSTIPAITDERCEEVIEINTAVTSLLKEITSLQSHIYEEKLLKTEFELQYLKSQISPHFLINCLSTIYSVSHSDNGEAVTQKMIQTLSEHLRYSLSSKQTVPLSEELYYVENYLQLTSIRFPGCLSYSIDIPTECRNAVFFPVFLLTLAENTIKVNMIMGEQLKIRITGSLIKDEHGISYVHLIYVDSGEGFTPESLPILNSLHEEIKNPTIDGHRIGLYNVVKRMELLYNTEGKLVFSNEPGWGARIDIMIPYVPYKGEEAL